MLHSVYNSATQMQHACFILGAMEILNGEKIAMIKIKLTFLTITVTFLSLTLSSSLALSASTAGAFLKIDPSARSYAMGQSGVVSALGAESMGSNPANLMDLPRKTELLTAYSSLTEGVSFGHIAGAINRSANKDLMVDALGFSYTRLGVDGIEGRDGIGNRTGDYGTADSQMSLTASGNAGRFKLGLTGKLVQSKIGNYKANTVFAGDLGLSYGFKGLGREMRGGLSLNNVGQGMRYLNQKDPLPTAIHAGLTTQAGPMNLTGGLTQELKGEGTSVNFGMEFNLGVVSLRAGVNALGGVSGNKASGAAGIFEGLSSGLGLKLGMARVDYALGQSSADLGISHRASLTFQFGKQAN